MPTKARKDRKPRGSVRIVFSALISNLRYGRAGLHLAFKELYTKYRYGSLLPDDRLSAIFDEQFDLATLPIGLFDQKALSLPYIKLPECQDELIEFLRWLIHVGKDVALIDAVLATWEVTLDDHARVIWDLRDEHPELSDEIVSGRLGNAILRLRRVQSLTPEFFNDVIMIVARQALLWCAMDVQMVTARARASNIAPFGRLLSGTMRVIKPATVVRLMCGAEALLRVVVPTYQTIEDQEACGEKRPKLPGLAARTIAHRAATSLRGATPDQASQLRNDLDQTIPYIRARLDERSTPIYEVYAPVGAGGEAKEESGLKSFHAIWYSDLSPLSGMAVSLLRYAQAEEHIRDLIRDAAHGDAGPASSTPLQPLPPLPLAGAALSRLRERVLLLADHYRRAILRDSDYRSRSPDALFEPRDPLDRSGWTFVGAAITFLHRCGQRNRDLDLYSAADKDALTFFALDVVPELRLDLHAVRDA